LDVAPNEEKNKTMSVAPVSQAKTQAQSASISVIVPLFFKNPANWDAIREQLTPFFDQFCHPAKEQLPFDIFLSDSGPGEEHQESIQTGIAAILENKPELQNRVTYSRVVTNSRPLSRAEAMNLGVTESTGQVCLFLHIDCHLPSHALQEILQVVSHGALGGGFTKTYSDKRAFSPLFCTQFYLNQVRTLRGRHFVGTNAMFMKRSLALEHPYVGDFLEDVEMSDWLRSRLRPGALKVIPKDVTVSARKYQKYGPIPSIAINGSVMILYRLFRVRPALLRKHIYHFTFPKGLKFWFVWLQTVFILLDRGGRREQ
jgi:hypothetical protein